MMGSAKVNAYHAKKKGTQLELVDKNGLNTIQDPNSCLHLIDKTKSTGKTSALYHVTKPQVLIPKP